jgi:hypothetical protein
MYQLSEQQIAFILDDISARGIETDSLQQDLLDHICCVIEHGLEENGDFGAFYQTIIQTFYKKDLREIEQETALLLTFKNYYAMKKVMIISGVATVLAFIVGSVFKIMHWPGAAILLTLGFVGISLFFLPLLFIFKIQEIPALRDRVILGLGIFSGSLYFLSMLFKVQSWPGANIMWFSNLLLSFFVFLPLFFFSGIRKPETRLNTIVSSIVLLAVIGSQFTLTALYRQAREAAAPVTTVVTPAN